ARGRVTSTGCRRSSTAVSLENASDPTPAGAHGPGASQAPGPAPPSVPYRTLIWLAVATFTTGIDGYVLAGLLPAIAPGLHVPAALARPPVSGFALPAPI